MMKMLTYVAMTAMVIGTSTAVFAQRGMRRGGPAMYDASTEVRLSGAVADVQRTQATGRGQGGIHLVFNAESGTVTVHVGPAAYVASKHFTFAKGDTLIVIGSKVKMAGEEVILAREISKGGELLTLRSDKGFPMWSGRMSRP